MSDLACLDISSKKRCLYRHFTYYLKAHTISNKLVIKISAQKKGGGGGGGEVMTATNMCSNFGSKWSSLPLNLIDGPTPLKNSFFQCIFMLLCRYNN